MDGRKRQRRRLPLTVCIAARAKDGSIFCAADRMITAGDMEMESSVPKMQTMTTSIVVMPSDEDAALHTLILNDTIIAVKARIADKPKEWLPVIDVVNFYIAARDAMRAKMAERVFLIPLGLTYESFHDKMATMSAGSKRRAESRAAWRRRPGRCGG